MQYDTKRAIKTEGIYKDDIKDIQKHLDEFLDTVKELLVTHPAFPKLWLEQSCGLAPIFYRFFIIQAVYEIAMRWTKGKHAFILATYIDKAHIHNHTIYNYATWKLPGSSTSSSSLAGRSATKRCGLHGS